MSHRFTLVCREASGRQMWTNAEPKNNDSKKVDENLVREMASGGRQNLGFNAASNSNRYGVLISCFA